MEDLLDDFEDFGFDDVDNLSEEEEVEDDNTVEDDSEEGEQELQEEDDDSTEEEDSELEGDDEDTEESDDEDEVSYTPFVSSLIEEGVLDWDGETEYDDSPEGFKQMIQDNIDKKVDAVIASLPEDVQRLIEIGMKGGDIKEVFTKYENNYADANIEDEDVAKQLITEYYKLTNPKWNDARIARQLEMLDDAGELEDEAKLAKEFHVERTESEKQAYLENLKQQQEQAEAQYYQELDEYTQMIDKAEGFAGIKFASRAEKEAFKKYCFEVGEDGMTEAQRRDNDRERRLTKEFYAFRDFNYEAIKRSAKTDTSLALKKQLSRFTDRNSKSNRTDSTRAKDTTSRKFSLGTLPDDF